MIAVGDPLMWGKALICHLDLLSREACCMLGAQMQYVTERLLRFLWPSDYKTLLLYLVHISDTARRDLKSITHD